MRILLPFAMASSMIFIHGCKCERPEASSDTNARQESDEASTALTDEGNAVNDNTMTDTSVTELKIVDLAEGEGEEAVSGASITVHYRGKLLDGAQFDSSYDRGQPFTFNLGAGQVIKGWDQGVQGMKVGGKRKLIIPAHLGYGERGAGNLIPPNSTLEFEVELIEVNK